MTRSTGRLPRVAREYAVLGDGLLVGSDLDEPAELPALIGDAVDRASRERTPTRGTRP
jgi:hypothetical protein